MDTMATAFEVWLESEKARQAELRKEAQALNDAERAEHEKLVADFFARVRAAIDGLLPAGLGQFVTFDPDQWVDFECEYLCALIEAPSCAPVRLHLAVSPVSVAGRSQALELPFVNLLEPRAGMAGDVRFGWSDEIYEYGSPRERMNRFELGQIGQVMCSARELHELFQQRVGELEDKRAALATQLEENELDLVAKQLKENELAWERLEPASPEERLRDALADLVGEVLDAVLVARRL
jgi:hypothetical protein